MQEIIAASLRGAGLLPVALDREADLEGDVGLAVDCLAGEALAHAQRCCVRNLDIAQCHEGVTRDRFGAEDEVRGRVVDPLDSVDRAKMRPHVRLDVVCV